jgi:hypothetical protein
MVTSPIPGWYLIIDLQAGSTLSLSSDKAFLLPIRQLRNILAMDMSPDSYILTARTVFFLTPILT